MKVILGPIPCATCHAPVTVVRRDYEQGCVHCDFHGGSHCQCAKVHTHTIPDVGPFTAVDADGSRHECERA